MMRNFWKSGLLAALLVGGCLGTGCQSKPAGEQAAAVETPAATTAPDSSAVPAVTAAYICPMGCEGSASAQPGKCPVCGMDLEANPSAKPASAL